MLLTAFFPDVKFSVPAKSEELAIQEITPEEKVEISSEKDINFNQSQEFEIKQEPIFKQEIALQMKPKRRRRRSD